jgi:hypothetical protein
VTADPAPEDTVFYLGSKCSIVETDANRPVLANLLEMKRWMTRIRDQQLVVAFCEFLYFRW